MSHYVHPQGICETSTVGEGTTIWAFAHVLPGARIGSDCNLNDHVFVEGDVVVGDERWAITFNLARSQRIGNVYDSDGSVTSLVCFSNTDAWLDGDDPIDFQCPGAGSCSEDVCPPYDNTGAPSVPRSFFEARCIPGAIGRNTARRTDWNGWIGFSEPVLTEEDCPFDGGVRLCAEWAYKNTEESEGSNSGSCSLLGCQR